MPDLTAHLNTYHPYLTTHYPPFTHTAQAEALVPDLSAYLDTLVAVHGGADLRSAAEAVMGYERGAVKGARRLGGRGIGKKTALR